MSVFVIWQAREFLSKLGDLKQTQIFAKIENIEVRNFYIFFNIITDKGSRSRLFGACFIVILKCIFCL